MKAIFALALTLTFSISLSARASIDIEGNTADSVTGLGNFKATLSYVAVDASNASLTVSITNTTSFGDGFLTAFVFNNPSDRIAAASLLSGDPAFPDFSEVLFGSDSVGGSPFGDFDLGLALAGGDFENGGVDPAQGIGVGSTGVFTFGLTGVDLDLLTEQDFVSTFSSSEDPSEAVAFFAARFQQIDGDSSDKVPAQIIAVPETGSLAIWGSLLAGGIPLLIQYRRRR